jgi:hypothetical protein
VYLEKDPMAWARVSISLFLLALCAAFACGQNSAVAPSETIEPSIDAAAASAPTVVIGFVGGFVKHDDAVHSPVQVGAHLRADYPTGVHVAVFENRRRDDAYQEVVRLLDTNHDGTLSDTEKRNAHIIIYGMSWGGSETIELARALDKDKIPVLLTIQVDSVEKHGENDRIIPANVAEAVNFYQTDGLLHGESEIRAADASRTRILGNYRYEYKSSPLDCASYPWYDRVFVKPHTEIECDAKVWGRVESLIRSKLPPAGPAAAETQSHTP